MDLAATNGSNMACTFVSSMYHYGHGVPQNYKKALHFAKLAVEKGNPLAHYNLAELYYYGHGVEQNLVKSYAHLLVALAIADEESKKIAKTLHTSLMEKLSKRQLAEGQKYSEKLWENTEKILSERRKNRTEFENLSHSFSEEVGN